MALDHIGLTRLARRTQSVQVIHILYPGPDYICSFWLIIYLTNQGHPPSPIRQLYSRFLVLLPCT